MENRSRDTTFQILIPLSLGAIGAVLFFTQIVILSDLLKEYPTIIYSIFLDWYLVQRL